MKIIKLTALLLTAFLLLSPVAEAITPQASLERFNNLTDSSYEFGYQLTREDFCVAVAKLFAEARVTETDLPFADIGEIRSESLPYLSALYEAGILTGASEGGRLYMRPNSPITRQEAITLLGRFLGQPSESPLTFSDVETIGSFAYPYIAWFFDYGIVTGFADGTFKPHNLMTAGELAILTTRTLVYADIGKTEIETVFGTGGQGLADGNRENARFTLPYGLISARGGELTVFDTFSNAIRTVTPTGVRTLAGSVEFYDNNGFPKGFYLDEALGKALLNRPSDGARNSRGELFIADSANHVIRFVRDGSMYTFSGTQAGFANGARNVARFNTPMAIAIDQSNNIYVADTLNHCIRRIDPNGNVTTIAGTPQAHGHRDGAAAQAQFRAPAGIAVSADGRVVYVSDTGNHMIRKIENNQVTTIAGTPIGTDEDGDPAGGFKNGTAAVFNLPRGIAVHEGVVFVADSGNHMIRAVTASGAAITIAGNGEAGDAQGSCLGPVLNGARGISISDGILYIADTGNNKIKRLPLSMDLYR
jgi:sugar lactone lactonase YvrE